MLMRSSRVGLQERCEGRTGADAQAGRYEGALQTSNEDTLDEGEKTWRIFTTIQMQIWQWFSKSASPSLAMAARDMRMRSICAIADAMWWWAFPLAARAVRKRKLMVCVL